MSKLGPGTHSYSPLTSRFSLLLKQSRFVLRARKKQPGKKQAKQEANQANQLSFLVLPSLLDLAPWTRGGGYWVGLYSRRSGWVGTIIWSFWCDLACGLFLAREGFRGPSFPTTPQDGLLPPSFFSSSPPFSVLSFLSALYYTVLCDVTLLVHVLFFSALHTHSNPWSCTSWTLVKIEMQGRSIRARVRVRVRATAGMFVSFLGWLQSHRSHFLWRV